MTHPRPMMGVKVVSGNSCRPAPQLGNRRHERGWERLSAFLLASAIVLAWEVWVRLSGVSPFVLPSPLAIIGRIMIDFPLIFSHLYITFFEVAAGFGLAVALGLPTSLAIFYSRVVERAVFPLLIAVQTIPKIALAPLLVLYLGYGWAPKIALAFLISFFPIVIAAVVGLRSLDKGFVALTRSMGATEWQIFTTVRLPAALPNIFGGFKVGISLAIIGAIIGEYLAAERGLGYLQLQAASRFDTTLNFAALVTIAGMGVSLFAALSYVEGKVSYQRESPR